MAWTKFERFESVLQELEILPLVGVVPLCQDPCLEVENKRDNFWARVRHWQSVGWAIAQHGYTHRYVTESPGILKIGSQSEFAGLPYAEQYKKLREGKRILMAEEAWQPVFMAPSHSFDQITLEVLADLGFEFITDGFGVYPYRLGKLTAVPQLFASPLHFGLGVYTICLHVNSLSEAQIDHWIKFLYVNRKRFVSFRDAAQIRPRFPGAAVCARLITSTGLNVARRIRGKGVFKCVG
jgi:hypothetical protein